MLTALLIQRHILKELLLVFRLLRQLKRDCGIDVIVFDLIHVVGVGLAIESLGILIRVRNAKPGDGVPKLTSSKRSLTSPTHRLSIFRLHVTKIPASPGSIVTALGRWNQLRCWDVREQSHLSVRSRSIITKFVLHIILYSLRLVSNCLSIE